MPNENNSTHEAAQIAGLSVAAGSASYGQLLSDARKLRDALGDYFWDMVRIAEGMPAKKDPFDLARNAENALRDTEYLGGANEKGWTAGPVMGGPNVQSEPRPGDALTKQSQRKETT